ncbi:GTP-binding protein [Candidatus Micrarchaeota archaeon CG1_02_55_22]|nr:MAG: GTP-binding protein [Candidatus Micrarchaeota archaeon CG1_02_55_22]
MPFRKFFSWIKGFFGHRKSFSLGLYGQPGAGKSTIANRIAKEWTGEEMSTVSEVPHETRQVVKKEQIVISSNGKTFSMNLLDMPGIATKVDYKDFVKTGMNAKKAQTRAREATKGIIEAIKWLEHVDAALVVMDATEDPYTQVNITILGNLEARGIPVILIANKIDLKKARVDKIKDAFPQHVVVPISALTGENFPKIYEEIAKRA